MNNFQTQNRKREWKPYNIWWQEKNEQEALEKERRLKEQEAEQELKDQLEFKKTMDDFMLPKLAIRNGKFVLLVPDGREWFQAIGYSEAYRYCIAKIQKYIPDIQYHRSLMSIDVYGKTGLLSRSSKA